MEHLSNLSEDEAIELGTKVGALIGLGIDGEEGIEAGAAAGAEAAAAGVSVLPADEAWDVLEDIPNDSAAALLLLEHHWAVPLRDAIARAGGFRISDGFISPLDLVEIGLVSAEEASNSTTWRPPRPRTEHQLSPTLTRPSGGQHVRISKGRSAHLAAYRQAGLPPSLARDHAGHVIGSILPLAIAVTISPIPIIAEILLFTGDRPPTPPVGWPDSSSVEVISARVRRRITSTRVYMSIVDITGCGTWSPYRRSSTKIRF